MEFSNELIALASFVAAVNFTGFISMVWDKECAKTGMWRVPEHILLALALVGGSIGVIAVQRIWRHKTQQQPFRTYLRMIVIIQFAVLISLALPDVRNAVWEFLKLTPG